MPSRWSSIVRVVALLLATTDLGLAQESLVADIVAAGWLGDATELYRVLEETHPNLYTSTSRKDWDRAHAELLASIPGSTRPELVVQIHRFLALSADGHTNIIPYMVEGPGFSVRFPFSLFWFEEGLYVTHTTEEMAHLAGLQLTAINDHPAEEVALAAGRIISHSNPMWPLRWAPYLLSRPGYLHGLGFGAGGLEEGEKFTFATADGKTIDEIVVPVEVTDDFRLLGMFETAAKNTPKPRYFDSEIPYSMEVLSDRKAIYVLYNRVESTEEESIYAFAERLSETIDGNNIERLIIDVRNNGGGDNTFNQPLIQAMIRAEKVNRPGGLFVITGRQTFSAAQNFVTWAERHTQALIVGEPASGKPNHYGDPTFVELPNANVLVIVSTLFWQDSNPSDQRQWILPDVPVRPRFADLLRGADPALEAALSYNVESAEVVPPVLRWQRASQQGEWSTPWSPDQTSGLNLRPGLIRDRVKKSPTS